MTYLEYLKGIKYLNTLYVRPNEESLLYSYEEFKDIQFDLLMKAIKEIARCSNYYPTAKVLRDKCESIITRNKLEIITKMKDDGYFKKGDYGELSDEQAIRNYDKTLMWLEKKINPKWFEDDINSYSIKRQIKLLN